MDVKTILGLTSAIVGTGVIVGQDPSFENPGVQPILTSGNQNTSTNSNQDKRVSVRFKQASTEEIFDWLSNQGVSFVTVGVPKEAKVDLNLSNVPLTEVIDVLAEALGGSFVKRGTTYIFQKGTRNMFAIAQATEAPGMQFAPVRELEDMRVSLPPMNEAGFQVFQGQNSAEAKAMREKMLKEFGPDSAFMKQLHKELGDSKRWEELSKGFAKQRSNNGAFEIEMKAFSEQDAKKWEQFGKQMEKQFGPGSKFEKDMKAWGELHGKEMEKKFGPGSKFEKDMKVWGEQYGKQMEKEFGPGSKFEKDMKAWGELHGKEMEKKFGPGSEFQKQFGPGSKFEKDMKAFELKDGKMRELSQKEREQMMKEMEKHMKDMKMKVVVPPIPPMPPMPQMDAKAFVVPKMPDTNIAFGHNHGADIQDIAKTLTPAQREKNKKQGFLYWSDLNKDQQSKLDMKTWTGQWTVSYNKDGESFTLKSDRK